MGYETTLLFVSHYREKFVDFGKIEATLRMGKIAYDYISDLIGKHTRKNKKLIEKAKRWSNLHNEIYNLDGNHTMEFKELSEKEQQKKVDKLHKLEESLNAKLPYVYHTSGNKQDYLDCYDDLLIVVPLEELREAIIKSQAKTITDGQYELGYRRFDMALRMIEMFDKKIWGSKDVKVILYGH